MRVSRLGGAVSTDRFFTPVEISALKSALGCPGSRGRLLQPEIVRWASRAQAVAALATATPEGSCNAFPFSNKQAARSTPCTSDTVQHIV